MAQIRKMSFHADQMHKRQGGVQRLNWNTKDGNVQLMRAGKINYVTITPSLVLDVCYIVQYQDLDSLYRVKFLDVNRKEIADIAYTGDVIPLISPYLHTAEWGMGTLICMYSLSPAAKLFYVPSTGQFLDYVLCSTGGAVTNIYVSGSTVYAAIEFSGSLSWLRKVTVVFANGEYSFSEETFEIPGVLQLEESTFFYPVQLVDGIWPYQSVGIVDKDTGAVTFMSGYASYVGSTYNLKEWASPSSYFTFSGELTATEYSYMGNLTSPYISSVYSLTAAGDVGFRGNMLYNLRDSRNFHVPIHGSPLGTSFHDTMIDTFDGWADAALSSDIYSYQGAKILSLQNMEHSITVSCINSVLQFTACDVSYFLSFTFFDWKNITPTLFRLYNTHYGIDYIQWEGAEVSLEELYALFRLTNAVSTLHCISYVPGIINNKEIAKLIH